MPAHLIARVAEALRSHQDEILRFAEDLVAIPSENPPGANYQACMARIVAELDRLGLDHRLLAAPDGLRPNLLSFVGSGPRTVYFHGHYDVVPAQDRRQFTPRVEHGWLHGRGTADMKAGLAAMTYAALVLRELRLPGRVGLCMVADEETGGQGGSRYLEELGLLGEGGLAMLTMEPTGGVVWNANRGCITLSVEVKGKPAHVGLQYQGVNAFERMLDVAAELRRLKEEVETRRTGFRIVPDEAGRSILMLGGRVEGGTNFNVVPDSCRFTVERRFNPEESLEVERDRLWAVLDGCRARGIDLEVTTLQEGPASGVEDTHPVARALAGAIRSVTGEEPVFGLCPGLLETRWYAARGIPAFAYGPGLLECAHGPDERVEIARLHQCATVYAVTAARLLAAPL